MYNANFRGFVAGFLLAVCSNIVIGQTNQSIRVSILGGYGLGTDSKISISNSATLQPYRLGIGIRAQYVFASNLCLGVLFVSHQGESATIDASQNATRITFSTRMQYEGIEIGYWLNLDKTYSVCPHIGVGLGEPKGNFSPELAHVVGPDEVGVVSVTGLRPYISPDLSIVADISNLFFVGLEASYVAITDYKDANALSAFVYVGFNIGAFH